MKDFLEQTLRQSVLVEETEYLNDKLPLAYRGRYSLYKVETNGQLWIAIRPKDDASLVMLRKDRAKIEKVAGLNCAIFLDSTTFYIKEKLVEEGIPFVLKGKQVYLPFIGLLLSNENKRDIAPVHLISFLIHLVVSLPHLRISIVCNGSCSTINASSSSRPVLICSIPKGSNNLLASA